MKIQRKFTEADKDAFAGFEFDYRTSKITNPDGSVVFEMKNVEVPKSWSQVATDILAQKYCRKKGVPQRNEAGQIVKDLSGKVVLGSETSIKQVANRLASTWRHWGEGYGYFETAEDAQSYEDEMKYMITAQIAAPNSPQWFNTGLAHAYGINAEAQGHYFVDPETGELEKSKDAYTRPQPHACFIQAVKDDLVNEGGIFDLVTRETRLFKYGSGTGTNFSAIRGGNENLSGGGKSSGLMSFLSVFDRAAGAIKSGGTTRRAAKMVCLDMDHPEIEEFVEWKVIEEQKVAALVSGSHICYEELKKIVDSAFEKGIDPEQNEELRLLIYKANKKHVPLNYIKRVLMQIQDGMKPEEFDFRKYETDFRSEAYTTVGGQNSNNSVRVPNDFIEALKNDGEWALRNRKDGEIYKKISAKKLWDKIAYAAWSCADPGIQYDSTINEWHTCPEDGKINASNPCSEYMFLDDTACNLASLNLIKFYDSEAKRFDIEGYKHAIRLWTITLEISVLMAQFPSKELAIKSFDFRTLGLGYANIGSLLMKMGIPYASEEGYSLCGALTAILTGEAYAASAELSRELGPFNKYEKNKKHMLKVIRNHRRAAYNSSENEYEKLTVKPQGINSEFVSSKYLNAAKEAWDKALEMGEKYGYRNAQVSVIAPTGTIGLVMDCDTTGIEPDFALVKFKKLVGGGYFKIANASIAPALKNLGYSEAQIKDIINYVKGHATLEGSPHINAKSLRKKGFTSKEIMMIEGQLATVFDIKFAFNKYILGEEFLKNVLSISDENLNDPSFNLLKSLGFSDQEIAEANEYVCGAMTVEGAPHIKDEAHLAVFDCANKCGNKGQRYIPYMGHLRMMAAAQPFISGSISKTVNMPEESTLRDIQDAYMRSWELMLKCNALYRDGSKLSQPLNTSSSEAAYAELFNFADFEDVDENNGPKEVQKVIEKIVERPLRRKLPDERRSLTHKFNISGHEGYITVGLYEDNSPGEIFINMNKEGSTMSGIMDALAISLSMNLQYGVPLEVLVAKYTHTRFEPAGMTSNRDIPMVKSLIDYIARWMALKFLPKDTAKKYHNADLVDRAYDQGTSLLLQKVPVENVDEVTDLENLTKAIDEEKQLVAAIGKVEKTSDVAGSSSSGSGVSSHSREFDFGKMQADLALKASDADAPNCAECGMTMVRNGACYKCEDCGSTSGCS
ncbi:adenosylcobalamin-dependent ribonucleoside-diphosphate reductase [Candidatus Peregrinibacteria bacterium]|nr:adenosylcobalamin-dependent ribonucleoside-diphosphate reductase [Candidatus Peregrinibacteria bacterium]